MNQQQILDFELLLERLISKPTISRPGFQLDDSLVVALKELLGIASKDGFQVKCHEYFGLIKTDTDFEKTLSFFFHLDVVGVLGQAWNSDPFMLTKDKDGYYGRGVMDDKGPLALVYTVLKSVNVIDLTHNVEIFIGLDEEMSFKCVKQYNTLYRSPDLGIVVDAKFPVIFGEKGSAHAKVEFEIDSKYQIIPMTNTYNTVVEKVGYYKNGEYYESLGREAHSSKSDFLENSVYKFLEVVLEKPVIEKFELCFRGFNENELGKTVVNPTFMWQCGNKLNIYFDIRFTMEDDLNILGMLFDQKIEITKPKKVCYEAKMVEQLLKIYQKHSNDLISMPRTSSAGTYSAYLKNTYVYGFELVGQVSNVHGANEFLSFENVQTAFKIYEDLILNVEI